MSKNLFSGVIIASLVASPLCAQEQAEPEDNLVVHGVRLEQPETETGSSVYVLSADDIDALGVDYVLDAIATAPGVTVNQNGSQGGAASIRIRGAASAQTLVIIDGVVVNDPSAPSGGFDFARIDPANVERIEILKGPQSTLWGTDAMGGVVNIITKRPADGMSGSAFAQGGSFGSMRGGATFSGTGERYDFRLAAVRSTTDGISKADRANGNNEDDAYESNSVNASAGARLGEARVQATLLWTDAIAEFDSFSFGAPGNVADGDEVSETKELAANLSLTLPLFDGKFSNLLLAGYSDIDRQSFSGGQPGFASDGNRMILRYQGTLSVGDANRVAFGAEREEIEAGSLDASINGLFALYEVRPTESLTLTAGIRNDDHEQYGNETTGRIAAAFNPHDQLTLRASWGEGFKAPTLFQTTYFCCGASTANADLQPETSSAFDVGFTVRSATGQSEIGLTYFDQKTRNLIDFSFPIGAYENIASATSSGIELNGDFRFNDRYGISFSYSYIDAKDGNGTALVRVPKRSGDLRLIINPDGRLTSNISLHYNGEEQDPNGVVGSWTRVDVAGRYAMTESVELYARIENLLDRQYQQVIGYGTPDLSGYLGARFSF
tara:strand:+ start:2428 stop:4257 length:1830 start_codon:yes stop_codon:yes gene_type:complete